MSALPRPDLPPGPHRELVDALHGLHHRAGWPSLRTLARASGVSHTTVSKAFSQPVLPTWGTLELLAEAMHGDARQFHELWLAASTPTDSTPPPARIAGRRAELDVVRRHLEAGTGLLLVTGEAGIGKTTVLGAAASDSNVFVATGHCLPLSTEVPLLPIADCLRSVHDADPIWFGAALAACQPYVAATLAGLVPEAMPEADVVRRDDRQLLFTAIAALLRALAADRPLALYVDDLHWADPTTLDVLEHLLGRASPVLVLGSWRTGDDSTPEPTQEWLVRVQRLTTTTSVALAPLTLDETAEQLRLLGVSAPDRLDRIHRRSRGQPLFTEQLAAHLDDDNGLPDLLVHLLDRRLDAVTTRGWVVLRTLGVAGRPLHPDVLAAAGSIPPDELTSQLRHLRARRLLRDSGGAVEIQHPLLAEAVRRRLVAGEAIAVHRALAEVLSDRPGAEAAEVAEHWRRAGASEHEVTWRIAAARAAESRFDRRTEADHYLRAIDIYPATATATAGAELTLLAEIYLNAMDALRFSFRFDEAASLSSATEKLFDQVDDGLRADLLLRRAIYRGELEGIEVGTALLDEALALCAGLPVRATTVRALDRKQNVLFLLGRVEEAHEVAAQQVAAATELGDPVMVRDALMRVAWHIGVSGRATEAVELMSSAAGQAGVHRDPLGDVRFGVYATDVLLICGASADEVRAAGANAMAVAHEHDLDNPQIMLVRVNIATAMIRDGRVAEAERVIDTPPDTELEVDRWPIHAVVALIESRRGRASAALERHEAIWDALGGGDSLDLELLAQSGDVACWAGAPALALGRLLDALDQLAGSSPVRMTAPALALAARAAADADDEAVVPRLRHLADRARLLDDRHLLDVSLAAHRATFEAELARLAGDETVESWATPARTWSILTRHHDAAYCRWRAAQVALRDDQGTVAARLLKRAANDAREHVPLSEAIAGTARTGR